MAITPDSINLRNFSRSSVEIDENGCWLWLGKTTPNGYATASLGYDRKRTRLVHRRLYEETYHMLGKETVLHHRCGVRHCVNPEHVFAVSLREHVAVHIAERNQKFTDDDIRAIRAFMDSGGTVFGASERFGVSIGYASKIRHRIARNEVPESC